MIAIAVVVALAVAGLAVFAVRRRWDRRSNSMANRARALDVLGNIAARPRPVAAPAVEDNLGMIAHVHVLDATSAHNVRAMPHTRTSRSRRSAVSARPAPDAVAHRPTIALLPTQIPAGRLSEDRRTETP